ncbi:hypothetical protein THAOC_22620, partial [Thalassiosira oceanica]
MLGYPDSIVEDTEPIHPWAYCGGSASLVRSGSLQRSRNKARPRLSEARRACSA